MFLVAKNRKRWKKNEKNVWFLQTTRKSFLLGAFGIIWGPVQAQHNAVELHAVHTQRIRRQGLKPQRYKKSLNIFRSFQDISSQCHCCVVNWSTFRLHAVQSNCISMWGVIITSRKNLRKWLYLTPVGTHSRGVALGFASSQEFINSLASNQRPKGPSVLRWKPGFCLMAKASGWLYQSHLIISPADPQICAWQKPGQLRLRWSWCHSTHNCLQVALDGKFRLLKSLLPLHPISLGTLIFMLSNLEILGCFPALHHNVCHWASIGGAASGASRSGSEDPSEEHPIPSCSPRSFLPWQFPNATWLTDEGPDAVHQRELPSAE